MRIPCLAPAVFALALAPSLTAQYVSDCESLTASAAGTLLTGQDGYFNPVAGSNDWRAYTYAGNPLGIPQNPNGGSQFIAGTSLGGTGLARAQRNITFGTTTAWSYSWDFCGAFVGTLPTAEYLGSFSEQPSTTNRNFNLLLSWGSNTTSGVAFNIATQVYNAAGTAQAIAAVPHPAFQNLQPLNWYRIEAVFDFASNTVTYLALTNLTTNARDVHWPTGWYLLGGAAPTQALPTAFRFFAGGGNTGGGNTFAADNIRIEPAPLSDHGPGCPATGGMPPHLMGTDPMLGSMFMSMAHVNAHHGTGFMATGLSDAMHGSSPLPIDLGNLGAPGCFVRVSPDIVVMAPVQHGMAMYMFSIPNAAGLTGIRFYHQFLYVDPTANALGAAMSNSLRGCFH